MNRDPKPFDDGTMSERDTNSAMGEIKDRASDMAASTKDKAEQIKDAVSEKLDEQRETAAAGLNRMASTIHDNADSAPGGRKVVQFTQNIADGMKSTANYLRGHDIRQMGEDFMDVCRKYPAQSLVAVLVLGFLAGRAARR